MKAVEYYLSRGINRVILGSAAVKNQQLVIDAVKEYGERIVVGIDAKDGMVRAEGWKAYGRCRSKDYCVHRH